MGKWVLGVRGGVHKLRIQDKSICDAKYSVFEPKISKIGFLIFSAEFPCEKSAKIGQKTLIFNFR